jgi:hypothetical protein
MTNRLGVTIAPLLVKCPNSILAGKLNSITVMACPICGFFYEDNDIVVMSCGCTYHPFCLVMYIMELKVDACARPTCGEVFSNHWIISFGFKHIHVPMKRIKLENLGCSLGLGRSTTKSF